VATDRIGDSTVFIRKNGGVYLNKISKVIIAVAGIFFVWFFLFGIRLIGYFDSVIHRGIRKTECGTNGCDDLVLFLNIAWTASFFIIIPLFVPIAFAVYFLLKKKAKSGDVD
jgi:hypothetical protein